MKTYRGLLILSLPLYLTGCAVGATSVLFATKSNFGLDVDTTPPTMEVGISRRETAVAPTYSAFQNHTLPLYADFGSKYGTLNKFMLGLSSTFAGGRAATITTNGTSSAPPGSSCIAFTLPADEEPTYWSFLSWKKPVPKPSRVRPFFFATDTVFGLKVVWNQPSDPMPDALKVGFNRKEFAWAPVHVNTGDCPETNSSDAGAAQMYHADMPSFFALLRNRNEISDLSNSNVRYLQIFATGKAADGAAALLGNEVRSRVTQLAGEADSGQQSTGPTGSAPQVPTGKE